MSYVDGYILPLPKKNLPAYRRIARKAGKIWMEYGALQYRECVADDANIKLAQSFPKGLKVKPSETVIFAYVVFKSRAHRDAVNKKVMQDPRLIEDMDEKDMPFDVKNMMYGGFKPIVDL